MRVPLFMRVLPLYALMTGVFLVPLLRDADTTAKSASSTRRLDAAHIDSSKPQSLSEPTNIAIPQIGLRLPVVAGSLDAVVGTWDVKDGVANFIMTSGLPGDTSSMTVLYAHDKDDGFGKIDSLKSGDRALVYGKSGTIALYELRELKIVQPEDVESIEQQPRHGGLVLITCDGLWSDERLVATFNLKELSRG